MKFFPLPLLLLLGATAATAQPTAPPHPDHPAESRENLLAVIHHVYLWYFDQSFFAPGTEVDGITVHYRTLQRSLDDGDASAFVEIYVPAVELAVELKRSDYHIAEIDRSVRDAFFKIRHVDRVAEAPVPLAEYKSTLITRSELHAWFSQHSHRAPPLADTLRARIRETLIKHQFTADWDESTVHIFHVAPISAVSNDLWIFHENTDQLLQFTADMDLNDPGTWAKTPLRLRFHQLDPQRILTPHRERGAAPELAKDFVGRALFNCIVLGNRIEVEPERIKTFHHGQPAAHQP